MEDDMDDMEDNQDGGKTGSQHMDTEFLSAAGTGEGRESEAKQEAGQGHGEYLQKTPQFCVLP